MAEISPKDNLHDFIKKNALLIGFDACGIATAKKFDKETKYLHNYIQQSRNADMDYLSRNIEKRIDIKLLFPPAESIIVVLKNYFPAEKQNNSDYKIAKFAYGKDYHVVIKEKLRQLEAAIIEISPQALCRSFVDTAPVLEKAWAQRAGLGWIGKNTCLINKKLGSFTFIGILATNLKLKTDTPHENLCGACALCIKACPARALIKPYQLNANKCLSYITIERKNIAIPANTITHNCIFGCDACQDICPWNKKNITHNDEELKILNIIKNFSNENWNKLDKLLFKKYFHNSSLQRAGFEKLKANINQVSANLKGK